MLADGLSEQTIRELADAHALTSSTRADVVEALAQSPWWSRGRLIRCTLDTRVQRLSTLRCSVRLSHEVAIRCRSGYSLRYVRTLPIFTVVSQGLCNDLHSVSADGRSRRALSERLVEMLDSNPERAKVFSSL